VAEIVNMKVMFFCYTANISIFFCQNKKTVPLLCLCDEPKIEVEYLKQIALKKMKLLKLISRMS